MIALHDDFNQHEVRKQKSAAGAGGKTQTLLQKLLGNRKLRKQRKADKVALNQLLQLDDALLKDMGISRTELHAVRSGTLSFDALIKHEIVSVRDTASNNQPSRKPPQ